MADVHSLPSGEFCYRNENCDRNKVEIKTKSGMCLYVVEV